MKRLLVWTGLLLSAKLAIAEPPPMTMHIFAPPPPVAKAAPDPLQNMVIFADEATPEPEPAPEPVAKKPRRFDFNYEVAAGYQQDQLSWSVAAPTGTPNPITQVKWQDLNLTRLQTAFDITTPKGFAFKGNGDYAWVMDGTGQEQNYGSAPQSSATSNGYAWNGSLAAGYPFKLTRRHSTLSATPLVGYSWQKQKNNLEQNRYTSNWEGPWLGMDFAVSLFDRHQLFSGFHYHWADYTANADWQSTANLQRALSFNHNANATGIFATAGYRYKVSEQWGMKLAVDYQKWQTEQGNERLFLSNGTLVNSVLNPVHRESVGVNVGVNFAF